MGFPVYKPYISYIQLIQVSTSILGTWNVWWMGEIILRIHGIGTPQSWQGTGVFGGDLEFQDSLP